MPAPIDFPNSPSAGDEYVAGGKVWRYLDGSWKRFPQTLSDGGFADTPLNNSFVDDGGRA
jgi:hypothetical protein